MQCLTDDLLERFSEARLESADEEQIESHLAQCPTCSQRLAQIERVAADPFLQEIKAAKLHNHSNDSTQSDCQSDSAPLILPEFIAGYRITGLLGRGGMGTVCKGFHPHLKRDVAIKVIRDHRAKNLRAIARFQREWDAIGKLKHPNIVQAYDAGIEGNQPYLVMEFLEGSDLSRYIKDNGTISVRRACEIIQQAACGLQHAHDAGVIHRDVKPSNLWLTPEGTVKILDLGLARFPDHENHETTTGCIVGSPGFISPEQSRGNPIDERSDIYSLGCTFYFLLRGKPPQNADVSEVRDPAKTILRKMLNPDPQRRYHSMSEVVSALEGRGKSFRWGITGFFMALALGVIISVFCWRLTGNIDHDQTPLFPPQELRDNGVQENWLTTKEIAEYLSVSENTVYRWINDENMPAHKLGRLWRFKKNEVDQWAKSRNANKQKGL